MRRRFVVLSLIFSILAAGAVPAMHAEAEPAHDQPRQSPVFVAQASPQVERGRALFGNSCARCHGAQGQGGDGPRLIGSPNGLREYQNALKLFDYVKVSMPENSPGSLKDEEYWDVLAFILDGNRLLPPNVALGPETAEQVKLTP